MRYTGGKGRAYPRIINLMPPHRVYIETHLGGGAVLRHKRPADRTIAIDRDPDVVRLWRERPPKIPGLELREGDALAFLRTYPFRGDELIYADPPYLPATRRRKRCYRFDYDEEDHVALLQRLREAPCAVLISGRASPLYADLLRGWREHSLNVATHVGLVLETVWCNFAPPSHLHDHRFVGGDFRERERVRRRVARWVRRLEALDPMERNALLAAADERFRPPNPAFRHNPAEVAEGPSA